MVDAKDTYLTRMLEYAVGVLLKKELPHQLIHNVDNSFKDSAPFDYWIGVGTDVFVAIEVKSEKYIQAEEMTKLLEGKGTYEAEYIVWTNGTKFIYSQRGESGRYSVKRSVGESFIPWLQELVVKYANRYLVSNRDALQTIQKTMTDFEFEEDHPESLDNKMEKLRTLFASCSPNDLIINKKNLTISLNSEKEARIFEILLGDYLEDSIVRFLPSRNLYKILTDGTINMCSLSCMNDPSEKNYADRMVGIETPEEDASSTFIISGCKIGTEEDLTMWRLYADDAQGACLNMVIKRDLLKDGFYLAPVCYAAKDGSHRELEIIKSLLDLKWESLWTFKLKDWNIWKHFFKKGNYSVENEVRLLFIPSRTKKKVDEKWFVDEHTNIYSAMKIFNGTDGSAAIFPLNINTIWLGIKFPAREENKQMIIKRIKTADNNGLILKNCEVKNSTIEDYR